MSTAKDTTTREQKGFQHTAVPINPLTSIHQGDLMYWDATLGIAKPALTDANAATLLGVADQTNPIPSYSQGLTIDSISPRFGDEHSFTTTPGETYNYFEKVFLAAAGTDSQTVTTVAGANYVGYVVLPKGVSSIVGAAGVSVAVRVVCRVPGIEVS